jgi:(R)-2-hydroxyacyl-CoA dehydratese activating ATPase
MLTLGVDIGSTTIEAVLLDDGKLLGRGKCPAAPSPAENASLLHSRILKQYGIRSHDVHRVIATGLGRHYFPAADATLSEIRCHGAGVGACFPSARTVIEIGGQDSKMMRLDARAHVLDFAMNDRCAAGTGRFLETVARTLAIPVEDTGTLALSTSAFCEITSMCAVFAETEIVGLLHQGIAPSAILNGVFQSVARRVIGMAGRIGWEDDVVFTGGVAHNSGVAAALQALTGRIIFVPDEPEFTGALGAALLAQDPPIHTVPEPQTLHHETGAIHD